jgi:hypothetical protein
MRTHAYIKGSLTFFGARLLHFSHTASYDLMIMNRRRYTSAMSSMLESGLPLKFVQCLINLCTVQFDPYSSQQFVLRLPVA